MEKVVCMALKVFGWLIAGALLVVSLLLGIALWLAEGWHVGLPTLAILLILWAGIWSRP